MFLAKVQVTLRKSILDPQGKAVEHAIGALGVNAVKEVRMGKYIELKLDVPDEDSARRTSEEVCRRLLANPVMEDFHVAIDRI